MEERGPNHRYVQMGPSLWKLIEGGVGAVVAVQAVRAQEVMATLEVEVGERIMLAMEVKMGRMASMVLGPIMAMVALGVDLTSLPYQSRTSLLRKNSESPLFSIVYILGLDVVDLPTATMAVVVAVSW